MKYDVTTKNGNNKHMCFNSSRVQNVNIVLDCNVFFRETAKLLSEYTSQAEDELSIVIRARKCVVAW